MSEELRYSGNISSYEVPATEEILHENAILAAYGEGQGNTVDLNPMSDPDPEATVIREILKDSTGIWGASITQREPDPPLYPNPTAEDFVRMEREDREDVIAIQKAMAEESRQQAQQAARSARVEKPPKPPDTKSFVRQVTAGRFEQPRALKGTEARAWREAQNDVPLPEHSKWQTIKDRLKRKPKNRK